MGAEEPSAAEVNQVIRCFSDPDFGFPGDLREKAAQGLSRGDRRYEDQAGGGTGAEFLQLFAAIATVLATVDFPRTTVDFP